MTDNCTNDLIETIEGSLIQHGKYNDRVYVMHSNPDRVLKLIEVIEELQRQNGYTKIFAKVPAESAVKFKSRGYIMEGYIPGYFSGKKDLVFMSKFFSKKRMIVPQSALALFDQILARPLTTPGDNAFTIGKMTEHDVDEMAVLYQDVFPTYPFPITDKAYLRETMHDNIYYYGIRDNDRLIALSSAETDKKSMAVEMTDFAVLPGYRGQNLSYHLLKAMEKDMPALGFKTFYTIARLNAPGMNLTFLKCGYKYSGTLINNTNISGTIESMNIFYKNIRMPPHS